MERALEALQAGAYRYLAKPLNLDELGMTIRMAAEHRRLRVQLETTRQEKEWLETFLEIGRVTTSVLGLDEVLERVHSQVGRLMDASCLDVVLYDESSQTLRFELGYDRGKREPRWERPISRGRGLTDWVIEHRQPLLIKDSTSQDSSVTPIQRGDHCRSWLGVPLVAQDRIIGAITVQSYQPHRFDETHQQILATIASQVANVIQNARLYYELSAAKDRLDALIASSFDAMILIDQDNKIQIFNRAAEEMLGWPAQEMVGQTVARLHTDVDKARQILETVNRDGAISEWNVDLRHRDGSAISGLLSAVLIRDNLGQPIGQAGFIRDLRRVKLLEGRLRALMEVTQVVTSTLALDAVLDLIVESSMAACPAAEAGIIHLYDEQTGLLKPKASTYQFGPEALQALTFRAGEGIAGWVYEQQKPLAVDDAQQDPRYKRLDHPEIPILKSIICVPLQTQGRVIGTLTLDNLDLPGAFRFEDIGLLRSFGYQAAIAIENARLLGQMQRARDAASVIAGVAVQEDLGQTLKTIVQHTRKVLRSDGVTLYSYDETTERFCEAEAEIVALQDPNSFCPPHRIPPGSAVRTILGLSQPPYYHVVEDHADQDPLLAGCFVRAEGIRSAIGLQLRVGERKVGVMFVNFRSPRRFTSDEIATIQLFADQAAVAVRNALLFRAEQQHGQALKAIQETSAAVSAVLDLDVLLPMITDKAAGIFTAPATSLMLWDDFGANLVIRAAHGLGTAYQQEQRITRSVVDEIIAHRGLGPHVFGIHQEPIGKPELVEQEGLYTTLVAPLQIGKDLIGILNIYSKDAPRRFTDREIELGAVFANHAAIAIKNAQLFQQANERLQESAIMQRVALALASTVELDPLLDQVVAAALQLTHADLGSVLLWDSRTQTFPRTYRKIGLDKRLQLYQSGVRREGGIARAIIDQRRPIVIPETLQDPRVHHDTIHKGRRALVGVPLLSQEEAIGVLFVKSTEPRDFPDRQVKLLEAFASQAAVAIEKANRYEELRRTKGLVGARTAVAWMGMVSSTWRHNVGNYATTIQDLVELARRDLAKGAAPDKIRERLSHITKMVNKIREAPITAPLQAEEGVGSVSINALLQERIMQLGGRDSFEQVKLTLDLSLDETTTVRASPHWLRRAFDIIIENAVDAMSHSATRELAILTRPADGKVEIIIQDTGPGVPEAVLPVLLQRPIPKAKGSKGLGVGLLMAHTIIQTYGGDLQLASTGPSGTTWFVWLPVEREEFTQR
jgi:PAS domain S-box-containing protein